MRIIVAGSRGITDYDRVSNAIAEAVKLWAPKEITICSGACPTGVDALGERWAMSNGAELYLFPAEWDLYGKSAGPRRNGRMALIAEALVAIWDGQSRGTKDMIQRMQAHKKLVYVDRDGQNDRWKR